MAPPTINLLTPITHPNVMGGTLCLDLLQPGKKELYQGWTSAYSVQSILMQLQSFLFKEPSKNQHDQIKKEIDQANEYVYPHKETRGLKQMIPFSAVETNPEMFIIHKSDLEILEEECVCFHTKLKLTKDNAILGSGVSITRLPRTGQIRSVTSAMDLLSLQAFMRDGLRTSLSNEKFTHFLPLYFGIEKERTIHLVKKSLSMISTGSTKKFAPSQILEILPKTFLTLMVDITGESIYHSNKAIKMMIYIHRLTLLLLELYPDQRKQIDAVIENFIKDKAARHKDQTPNLGELLIYLTLTEKYKWADLANVFLDEQFD